VVKLDAEAAVAPANARAMPATTATATRLNRVENMSISYS
jgi:hypothetical protein